MRRLWRWLMARPRVIRPPCGGEVIIKNVPANEADIITAKILDKPLPDAPPPPAKVYTHKALGTRHNLDTLKWELIVVHYNPETGEAGNIEVVLSHLNNRVIFEQFKVLAASNGLV